MHRLLYCFAAIFCLSQAVELRTSDPADSVTKSARVIGGTAAPIERYPYTAQVFRYNQFWCGATLISQRHVLSAAHCFINGTGALIPAENFFARVGSSFIALDSDGQTRAIETIVPHENYNPVNYDSDLAVLLLNATVTLNLRVQPAVLPLPGFNVTYGTFLVALGWGQTQHVPVSAVLNDVQLSKVNLTQCAEAYEQRANDTGVPYNVTSNMICSGWPGIGGFDACFGDSGGPLILNQNDTQLVVGVLSWGPTNLCGHPQYMGVSVRVSLFNNWINATVARLGNSALSSHLTNPVVLIVSLLAYLIVFKNY